MDVKEAAKAIRKVLREKFPETKFSVRIERFSCGNSIDIVWIDGPKKAEIRTIVDKFENGHFDGLTDSYIRDPKIGTEEQPGGADFICLHRIDRD